MSSTDSVRPLARRAFVKSAEAAGVDAHVGEVHVDVVDVVGVSAVFLQAPMAAAHRSCNGADSARMSASSALKRSPERALSRMAAQASPGGVSLRSWLRHGRILPGRDALTPFPRRPPGGAGVETDDAVIFFPSDPVLPARGGCFCRAGRPGRRRGHHPDPGPAFSRASP